MERCVKCRMSCLKGIALSIIYIEHLFNSMISNHLIIPMLRIVSLTVALVVGLAQPAYAEPPPNITAEEKMLLPPYCAHTMSKLLGRGEDIHQPSARARYWIEVLGGQGFNAVLWRMHHYCYALIHMARGQRAGLSHMQYVSAWSSVVMEINFTLQYAPPLESDFILMPEMMLYRGRALMRLKKPEQAIADFEKAIEAKADYWPPYLDIADHYASIGAKGKAISVLQQGLAITPDAKALKLRLKELGGVAPPPKAKTEAAPAASSSAEQP